MERPELPADPFADLMVEPAIAPGDAMWLRYEFFSGRARTGTLTADGTAIVLRDFVFDGGWSSIVGLGDGRVVFYNQSNSLLTVGQVDALGGYADVRNTEPAEQGHQMVAVNQDTVMFYLSVDGGTRGIAVTGRIRPDGSYQRLSEQFLLDFWTHLVPTGAGLILFYNAYTRLAATGRVTGDGGFTDLQTFPGFDPWTRIIGTPDGTLLFYNTTTGNAASGRVEADGSFVNLHSAFLGSVALVPTRDGRMLVFRPGDTLVARFPVNGWFSDARTVNGLIAPPPELFVR